MSTLPSSWASSEQRLWCAMRDGHRLDLAVSAPSGAVSTDCHVAADVLASLLLQPPSPRQGVVTRLQLTGAHITGRLLLQHARVEVPLSLINCRFDEPVELDCETVLRRLRSGPALAVDVLASNTGVIGCVAPVPFRQGPELSGSASACLWLVTLPTRRRVR